MKKIDTKLFNELIKYQSIYNGSMVQANITYDGEFYTAIGYSATEASTKVWNQIMSNKDN